MADVDADALLAQALVRGQLQAVAVQFCCTEQLKATAVGRCSGQLSRQTTTMILCKAVTSLTTQNTGQEAANARSSSNMESREVGWCRPGLPLQSFGYLLAVRLWYGVNPRANAGRGKANKKPCRSHPQNVDAVAETQPCSKPQQLDQQQVHPATDVTACNGINQTFPSASAANQVKQLMQSVQPFPPHISSSSTAPAAATQEEQWTETGRRKRRDVGQKREKGRSWSEQEEAAFLAGLEAHGRDWKAIGVHLVVSFSDRLGPVQAPAAVL